MEKEHVTYEDYKRLMDDYKASKNKIDETIIKLKPTLIVNYLIIPFQGGRAFYSRYYGRVTKIKSSKLTNPKCLEFKNVDMQPVYEHFAINL